MGKPGRPSKPGKPAGKPGQHGKSMDQVLVERAKHERENMERRRGKLEHLIGNMEPPQAMFLLQGKNLAAFVEEHNLKPTEIPTVKSMLEKRSRQ